MPTLKAEFSGGATGETINNPLVGQAAPPPSGADGEGKDGEEGGGGDEGSNSGNKQEHTVILFNISDDTNEYHNTSLEELKSDIIDELSQNTQNTQISKNEIGYGISVALEPTTGLVRKIKPQYIGITLDLTHLKLKTGKEPKEIFEICRKKVIYYLIGKN